jgi:thiamine biosynthesis lipoprotein
MQSPSSRRSFLRDVICPKRHSDNFRRDLGPDRSPILDQLWTLENQIADDSIRSAFKLEPARPDVPPSDAAQSHVSHFVRRAMACDFAVLLNTGQYPQGAEAAFAALDVVEATEAQLSVFRETSELSLVNRHAFERWVCVSEELFRLFQTCCRIWEKTQGTFDITASPLWKLWGFHRRNGRIPREQEIDCALKRVGSHHMLLDAHRSSVRFLIPGMELNLGAVGKGEALERAARCLREWGVEDFLVHAGGSSVLASGHRWPDASRCWEVDIPHPWRRDTVVARLPLVDVALATSGAAQQAFYYRGRRFGHILDPRTGWPADGLISATITAPSAVIADALSTACYVLGADGTPGLCASHYDIQALLLQHVQGRLTYSEFSGPAGQKDTLSG